jgi:hypothetical protein
LIQRVQIGVPGRGGFRKRVYVFAQMIERRKVVGVCETGGDGERVLQCFAGDKATSELPEGR